ncbi:MAG: hypothetical protein DRQ65_03390 [Gammaproteobacteria bacterium]|nr:MAG: hypothetical protein DRQ65_03390 [Gammaproteobacteria bacterium]
MTNPVMKMLFATLALLTLNGCPNTAYFEPTPIALPGEAMVYIYRPEATNPGKKLLRLSYPEALMDGESVGLLKYNKHLALEVAPGEHEFVVTGLTRDAKWEPKDRKYTLKVEAGKSYFLRFRVEFDTAKMSLGTFTGQYIITFHPVDETDAVYEIRHTSKAKDE